MRTLYRTKEFDVFFDSVDEKVRKKIAYIFEILTKQQRNKQQNSKETNEYRFIRVEGTGRQ